VDDLDHIPNPSDEPIPALEVSPPVEEVSQPPIQPPDAPQKIALLQKVRDVWFRYRKVIVGLTVASIASGMGWHAAHRKAAALPIQPAQTTPVRRIPAAKHKPAKAPVHKAVNKTSKKTAPKKKKQVKKADHKPWLSN